MFELFRRGEILPDGRANQDEAALIGNGNREIHQIRKENPGQEFKRLINSD
jgi:hypothetical protein